MIAAAQLGVKVRDAQAHGRPVPPDLQEKFERADDPCSSPAARRDIIITAGGKNPHAGRYRERHEAQPLGLAGRHVR
jgi:hypothetical protein